MVSPERVVQGILPGNRPGAKNGLSRVFSPGGGTSTLRYFLLLFAVILLFSLAGAAPVAPVAEFHAETPVGLAPLEVQFIDDSVGSPTGWTWYFGDEKYSMPWTLVNASFSWWMRAYHTSVALPDGSIVLMGGYDNNEGWKNDTWRSTDRGEHWEQMNASSGWSERDGHTSVALPDGTIVLTGGYGSGHRYNDTWGSGDNGVTWVRVNASSGWPARAGHSSVALPDGSIVLTGGYDGVKYYNDTWRSTDHGVTWMRVNTSPGWLARESHSSVALPDGSIVLTGGVSGTKYLNDTWRSTDTGATWTRLSAASGWSARSGHSSVALPGGGILLTGGSSGANTLWHDTWLSLDDGAAWTLLNRSSGWSARSGHSGVALPDGSVVLTGGVDLDEYNYDTWRLGTPGSTQRHPEHTYTVPGQYTVMLRVRNAGGHNMTIKAGYISVYKVPPSEVGVYRPSIATFILKNGTEKTKVPWGLSTDTPVAGDWNGDSMGDVGVFRPSVASFILKNGTERTVVPWGLGTDTPVAGDWNGDSMGDVGVYRSSIHTFILKNGTEKTLIAWGLGDDIPVSGDWNGDCLADVGVYRPSIHSFILNNGTERTVVPWGLGTDTPVAGDWNGDSMGDVGVYRSSIHTFILKDGTKKTVVPWGLGTDIPVAGKWR